MILTLFQLLLLVLPIVFVKVRCKENENTPMSKVNTNYLRGIAIFIVMAHHVSNDLGTRILTPLGGIGVAIFLIISGYGLNESFMTKDLRGFWINKIIRVVIPCWIVEIIYGLINYQSFDLTYFIKCIFCIEINWYIRYLIYWYIIFYLTSKYLTKLRFPVMTCIAIAMLIVFPEIEAEQSFSFIFGVLLSTKPKILNYLKNNILLISLGLFILGVVTLAFKQLPAIRLYEGTFIYNCLQLIIKLALGLSIIILSWRVLKSNWNYLFLGWLGTVSYELYLIHCKLLFIPREHTSYIGIVVFYLLTFILSQYLYKIDNLISNSYRKYNQSHLLKSNG